MNGKQLIGVVLLAAGLLALVYGGFTYTKEEHQVDLGPLEFSVKDKEKVNIPIWAGVASVVVGVVLLTRSKRG